VTDGDGPSAPVAACYEVLPPGLCARQVDQGVWMYMLATAGGIRRGEIARLPRDRASALLRGGWAVPVPVN